MTWRILILCIFTLMTHAGRAQEFAPPRPPPLDPSTDFDDMEEDMMEMGDEGFRPPPPPPPPGMPGAGAVPPPEIRPPVSNPGFTGAGMKDVKLKFKLVDEYWEKGKKRGRGKKIRVSGS